MLGDLLHPTPVNATRSSLLPAGASSVADRHRLQSMGWDTIISSVIVGLSIAYAGNKMSFRPELRDAVDAGQRFMTFLETIRIRVGDDHFRAGGVIQCPTNQSDTSNDSPAICSRDQN